MRDMNGKAANGGQLRLFQLHFGPVVTVIQQYIFYFEPMQFIVRLNLNSIATSRYIAFISLLLTLKLTVLSTVSCFLRQVGVSKSFGPVRNNNTDVCSSSTAIK